MQKKLKQIHSLVLVVALELEKMQAEATLEEKKRRRQKKPPHVHLVLIKGGG